MEGARRAGMAATAVAGFESNEQVARSLRESLGAGDVVLLKGSRVQRMEEILRALGYSADEIASLRSEKVTN